MLIKNSSSMMLTYHLPLHTKHLDYDNDDNYDNNDDDFEGDGDENICVKNLDYVPKD